MHHYHQGSFIDFVVKFCKQIVGESFLSFSSNMFWLRFRHFEAADKADPAAAAKLFSIPDFVGDACKAIASRVRGAVAGVPFDEFHKVPHPYLPTMYLHVHIYILCIRMTAIVCILIQRFRAVCAISSLI